jgi:Uma2 family endonuclease
VYDVPDWVTAGWPTEDELGVEDDQPVTSTRHREQASLLVHLLKRIWWDRPDVLVARDLGVFFRPEEPPAVPDVMVVFGFEPRGDCAAYLVWKERKGPNIVVDLLSTSDPHKDRERNYPIYEQRLLVPELIWFDPLDPSELRGFRLREGRYEELAPNEHGRLWSDELKVWFGVHERWLRLYDREGNLILTGDEVAAQAQAEAAQERAAREAAEALAQQARAAREQEQAARAEAEARAQQERAAREQERAAREATEAEVTRLREELARLKGRS